MNKKDTLFKTALAETYKYAGLLNIREQAKMSYSDVARAIRESAKFRGMRSAEVQVLAEAVTSHLKESVMSEIDQDIADAFEAGRSPSSIAGRIAAEYKISLTAAEKMVSDWQHDNHPAEAKRTTCSESVMSEIDQDIADAFEAGKSANAVAASLANAYNIERSAAVKLVADWQHANQPAEPVQESDYPSTFRQSHITHQSLTKVEFDNYDDWEAAVKSAGAAVIEPVDTLDDEAGIQAYDKNMTRVGLWADGFGELYKWSKPKARYEAVEVNEALIDYPTAARAADEASETARRTNSIGDHRKAESAHVLAGFAAKREHVAGVEKAHAKMAKFHFRTHNELLKKDTPSLAGTPFSKNGHMPGRTIHREANEGRATEYQDFDAWVDAARAAGAKVFKSVDPEDQDAGVRATGSGGDIGYWADGEGQVTQYVEASVKQVQESSITGPFTAIINTGEKPKSNTKTKKFRREDDAILWAEDWLEDFPQYVFASAKVQSSEGAVVWETEGYVEEPVVSEQIKTTGGNYKPGKYCVVHKGKVISTHDMKSGAAGACAKFRKENPGALAYVKPESEVTESRELDRVLGIPRGMERTAHGRLVRKPAGPDQTNKGVGGDGSSTKSKRTKAKASVGAYAVDGKINESSQKFTDMRDWASAVRYVDVKLFGGKAPLIDNEDAVSRVDPVSGEVWAFWNKPTATGWVNASGKRAVSEQSKTTGQEQGRELRQVKGVTRVLFDDEHDWAQTALNNGAKVYHCEDDALQAIRDDGVMGEFDRYLGEGWLYRGFITEGNKQKSKTASRNLPENFSGAIAEESNIQVGSKIRTIKQGQIPGTVEKVENGWVTFRHESGKLYRAPLSNVRIDEADCTSESLIGNSPADRAHQNFKRREHEQELGHEVAGSNHKWYIRINGKVWRKGGQAVSFENRAHANAAALKIQMRDPSRKVTMTNVPTDRPIAEAESMYAIPQDRQEAIINKLAYAKVHPANISRFKKEAHHYLSTNLKSPAATIVAGLQALAHVFARREVQESAILQALAKSESRRAVQESSVIDTREYDQLVDQVPHRAKQQYGIDAVARAVEAVLTRRGQAATVQDVLRLLAAPSDAADRDTEDWHDEQRNRPMYKSMGWL